MSVEAPFCDVYAHTHIGCVRDENQDTYLTRALHEGALAVVCDGMGGAAGGCVASGVASEAFCHRFSCAYDEILPNGAGEESDVHRVFGDAIYAANRAVFERAVTVPSLQGMGTTLSAVYLTADRLFCANVGDSRIYLFREGSLTRISHDDSLVQKMLDDGEITEADARQSECRHLLTRAVGIAPYVEFGFFSCPVAVGDIVMLCSDGLTAHYTDKELQACLQDEADLQRLTDSLLIGSCARGGRDNITLVLLRVR